MAPKFPNPDPPTDKVRDRLNQFIEVAGRAVYPPLGVAPAPATPGQIWWDISNEVYKIRNETNDLWDSFASTGGLVSYSEAQTLTAPEKTQVLGNIGAQASGGYLRYDASQSLTSPQLTQVQSNAGITSTLIASLIAQIPFGAVGSYVFARCSLGNTVIGGTEVAGSTLAPTAAISGMWINSVPQTYDGAFGAALTGQWRCMGRNWVYSDSATSITGASLFVRIS